MDSMHCGQNTSLIVVCVTYFCYLTCVSSSFSIAFSADSDVAKGVAAFESYFKQHITEFSLVNKVG